jgi:hypothetical protein
MHRSCASVTLLLDGRAVADTRSGGDGTFLFGRSASRYQVQAGAAGFQTRTSESIFVGRGGVARVDVALPLGPLETAVSVTAAATGVLPSQVGAAVSVLDGQTLDALGKVDLVDALRLVPGSSLVQTGGRGGTTADFIRGGNSNFNRVLVDGVPVNDIGGGVDLAQFALVGIDQVEVLRQANSVIAGPDALAGVIAATTKRGTTRQPEATVGLNGGTLGTHQETVGIGGLVGRVDYFSEFARFETDNDQPNNAYRIKTYAGRFGAAVAQNTYLSATIRWLDKFYASPNGMSLFGTPDDAWQTGRMSSVGLSGQTQLSDRWIASGRLGLSDQRARFVNPTTSGTVFSGVGFGDVRTITGAMATPPPAAACSTGVPTIRGVGGAPGRLRPDDLSGRPPPVDLGRWQLSGKRPTPTPTAIHDDPRQRDDLGRGARIGSGQGQPDGRCRRRAHRRLRVTLDTALGRRPAPETRPGVDLERHAADVQCRQGRQVDERHGGRSLPVSPARDGAGWTGDCRPERHRTDRTRTGPQRRRRDRAGSDRGAPAGPPELLQQRVLRPGGVRQP